jgi:hypothetical protein
MTTANQTYEPHWMPGQRVVALDYGTGKPHREARGGVRRGSIVERNENSQQYWFVLWDGYLEPWGHHEKYLMLESEYNEVSK